MGLMILVSMIVIMLSMFIGIVGLIIIMIS